MPKLEEHYITHVKRPPEWPSCEKSLKKLFFLTSIETTDNENPTYYLGTDTHELPASYVDENVASGEFIKLPSNITDNFNNQSRLYLAKDKELWVDSKGNVHWGSSKGRSAWHKLTGARPKTQILFSLGDHPAPTAD